MNTYCARHACDCWSNSSPATDGLRTVRACGASRGVAEPVLGASTPARDGSTKHFSDLPTPPPDTLAHLHFSCRAVALFPPSLALCFSIPLPFRDLRLLTLAIMPAQRYERVSQPPVCLMRVEQRIGGLQLTDGCTQIAGHDEDESLSSPLQHEHPNIIPSSPPPSFHSRASSPSGGASQRLPADDPLHNDADRTLADTFDSPSGDEDSDNEDEVDDRQRLMRGQPETQPAGSEETVRMSVQRRVTQLPVFNTSAPRSGRIYGAGNNDGVFANLSAKPTRGEDVEEKPPVRTCQTCITKEPCTNTDR